MSSFNLNNKQQEAVEADLGPVLVVAGAGSGKTRVLTSRFEYLINHFGFNYNEILAITFTNKAANEMKDRLNKSLGIKFFNWVGTFHSICVRILREDFGELKEYHNHESMNSNFNIIDDDDQLSIFKEAYRNHGIDPKDIPFKQMFSLIEKYKRNKLTIEDVKDQHNYEFLNIKNLRDALSKAFVIKYYETLCHNNNLLDFNDLLILTNKLLENDSIRAKWQSRFKYILVDEFQDTNQEQYTLIKHLSSNNNIFVVGDPDQMIYTWRGAEHSIINNFPKQFKDCQVIILDINYRSTQEILDVSNELITNNKNRIDKSLTSFQGYSHTKPVYYDAPSQDNESNWVCKQIKDLMSKGVKAEDIAILYRSNYLSRNIETELINNDIKYKMYGGIKFYQRKEIKDIIAYLKAIYFADELSIKRIINTPRRGISPNSIDTINKYALANQIQFANALFQVEDIEGLTTNCKKGVSDFVELIASIDTAQSLTNVFDEVLSKSKYIEYLYENEEQYKEENIEELRSSIIKYEIDNPGCSFYDYLQDISLMMDNDDKFSDAVSLMTIHVSKGLEFDYVFIIGMNEEIFPSRQATHTQDGLQEERRIAYVAMTRAKKQLYFSSHGGTNFMYNTMNRPSRFIQEVPSSLYDRAKQLARAVNKTNDDWFDSSSTPKINRAQKYTTEQIEYRVGDQVVHTTFGIGMVLAINDKELTIYFSKIKSKKVIRADHTSIKRMMN